MDAGTTIGLAIALGTLLVTLWLGRSRLRHERVLADLDDARSTLAEGAAVLKQVSDALNRVHERLLPFEKEKPEAGLLPIFEEGRAPIQRGEGVHAALRIRFVEESPPVEFFNEALAKASWTLTKIELLALRPKDGRPQADEEMFDAFREFDERRESFLVAAQKAVGSVLRA